MASPQMLVTDGIETLTIDGTDGWLDGDAPWTPLPPALKPRMVFAAGMDGGEQDGADFDNLSESVALQLLGSTTTVRANVQKLVRLFDRARRYNVPGTPPVYVKFRPDSSEAWYRSQLFSGRALYSKDILGWEWINAPASAITLTAIFTRRFYWEADIETELALAAEADSYVGATGGKTITNHDDSGHGNFVDVPGGQIAGDVRAPIRLELTNLAAASIASIWVGREWSDYAGQVAATLEGEAATPLSNGADGNASNGNFNRMIWNAAAETDIATWTFTAAQLVNAQGRWQRILARFNGAFAYTDLYLRVKLLEGAVTIFQSAKQLMTPNVALQEIASLPLPPNYLAAGSGVKLALQATRAGNGVGGANIASSTAANPSVVTTATPHGLVTNQMVLIAGHLVNTAINGNWFITVTGASTFTVPVLGIGGGGGATGTVVPASVLDLDYLQFLSLESFRRYYPLSGGGIGINATFVDEGMAGYVYTKVGGVLAQDWTADGSPLELKPHPSLSQRLRFLTRRSDGTSVIADTMTVKAFYRPRRLAI